MKLFSMRYLLTVLFLIYSATSVADTKEDVAQWAQKIFIATLSASYQDTQEDINAISKYYLPAAWNAMHGFFSDKQVIIDTQKLILHPIALTKPIVMATNDCGTPCWRVDQAFSIPEMRLRIDLGALVVNSTQTPPYLIQSLNIVVKNN